MHTPSGGTDSFLDDVMGGSYLEDSPKGTPESGKPCFRCKTEPRVGPSSYCRGCLRIMQAVDNKRLHSVRQMAEFNRPRRTS